MTDSDRNNFDHALDSLARILRVEPLDSELKFLYFKALKSHSVTHFVDGIDTLTQTYKPRRKDDFPVPAVISEAITGVVSASSVDDPMESRSYEEIKAGFRQRGILIGEEAMAAKRQEADESWQAVEPVLGNEPF